MSVFHFKNISVSMHTATSRTLAPSLFVKFHTRLSHTVIINNQFELPLVNYCPTNGERKIVFRMEGLVENVWVMSLALHHVNCSVLVLSKQQRTTKGASFWDYSGYSYSVLGITEYTEFHFEKNASSENEIPMAEVT